LKSQKNGMRAAQAHGRRSAHRGRILGMIGASESAQDGAHDGARSAPGGAACCAPRPCFTRDSRPLSKSFFSAWVFRRGGGAAAGCGALRPPHPHPCWQSVVAAPLSGPLPRIPGPFYKACENNLPVKISLSLHRHVLEHF
jgi:hypothetical protein